MDFLDVILTHAIPKGVMGDDVIIITWSFEEGSSKEEQKNHTTKVLQFISEANPRMLSIDHTYTANQTNLDELVNILSSYSFDSIIGIQSDEYETSKRYIHEDGVQFNHLLISQPKDVRKKVDSVWVLWKWIV